MAWRLAAALRLVLTFTVPVGDSTCYLHDFAPGIDIQ